MKTKILITWTEQTGYALACWRALAARDDIDLRVVAGASGSADRHNRFRSQHPEVGLTLLEHGDPTNAARVRHLAATFEPSVVVVSGWGNRAFTQLAAMKAETGWRVVMGLDSVLRRPVRQMLGRLRLACLLRHVDVFLVPGERGREFLHRWWHISQARIRTGLYGIDSEMWRAAHAARSGGHSWPRTFQFVGRYLPLKGVPELLAGYRIYRDGVADPIPLRLCGQGPLATEIRATPGVTDLGFIQPAELAHALTKAGCFILPSRYDAWPLALVEACAAGLPVIAGVGCGSAVEVVREGFNGTLVREASPDAIAAALYYLHGQYPAWAMMGERSASLAQPYAAEHWADNIARLARRLADDSRPTGSRSDADGPLSVVSREGVHPGPDRS